MNESSAPPPLPTLASARAQLGMLTTRHGWPFAKEIDLLEWRPELEERLAGMALFADGIRRDAWAEEVELSESLFKELSSHTAPEPMRDRARDHQAIDVSKPVTRSRCTSCALKKGLGPCPYCLGTARIPETDADDGRPGAWRSCQKCEGGFIRCTTCDGTGTSVRSTVIHLHDHVIRSQKLILPALPPLIDAAARTVLAADIPPDIAYARDPDPSAVASAYRGSTPASASDFFGYDLKDTLDRMRDEVAAFRGSPGLKKPDVRTFARPFLVVRWTAAGGKTAVFAIAAGELRGVIAEDLA